MGLLRLLAVAVFLVGHVWLAIVAADRSNGWALACMLLPGAGWIYTAGHFEEAKLPFFTQAGGAVLAFVSIAANWGEY